METQYVGFGRRLVAWILDVLVLGVIQFLVGLVLGGGSMALYTTNVDTAAVAGSGMLSTIVGIALSIGYVVFYQGSTGQTIGKKVMSIRVVDSSGDKPSYMTFFLRDIVGKAVSGIILLIGYFMVLWDSKKQGLHDKIAGTYVVRV